MENVKEVIMPRKRYTSEQIISKLREAEVELARGKKVPQVCRQLGSRSRPTTVGAKSTVAFEWIRPSVSGSLNEKMLV